MKKNSPTVLLKRIKSRCDAATIAYTDDSQIDEDVESIDLIVDFPCGRETRKVYLFDAEDLESFDSTEFEQYRLLTGYSAMCRYDAGSIEVILFNPTNSRSQYVRFQALKRLGLLADGEPSGSVKLKSVGQLTLELAPTSRAAKVLIQAGEQLGISLFVTDATVKTHDEAVRLLELVTNSLFFELDVQSGLHLSPLRFSGSRRRTGRSGKKADVQYPCNSYDSAPMALYWYARSAENMPLLQFLAYYQVVEYYYSVYFSADVSRRVRAIIKNPTFKADRDVDIAKILNALKAGGNRSAPEKDQLKATLRECVSNADLEEFLGESKERSDFFGSKAKGITGCLLSAGNRQIELYVQAADRIYDIRCKIVHTKGEHEEGELELLLPYSREAERLGDDIELMRFVAQKVLISASKQFAIH